MLTNSRIYIFIYINFCIISKSLFGWLEAIWEESEAIWNWRCIADEEGFDQIREVAEDPRQ